MAEVHESVEVNVPVSTAYNQWTQFEEFPRFLKHIESITQKNDTMLHWKVNVGGQVREFDAEIAEQHPDERVAWNSTGGEVDHAGVVTFHKLDDSKSRVTVQIDWEPESLLEKIGAAAGAGNRAVKNALEDFKKYIESQGSADGAWRGDVPA
jgi:uncharacterized membrane protein